MSTLGAVRKVVDGLFDGVEVTETPDWVILSLQSSLNEHGVFLALVQSGFFSLNQQYVTIRNHQRKTYTILVAQGEDE